MPESDVDDLLRAVALARAALAEITPEKTIGEPIGHVVEGEGAVSLLFASLLPGYPGWRWTVTVGRAEEGADPTVLEAELTPGEGALLAPDWVPWSERLAEYQAAQEALAAEAVVEEDEDEGDDDLDDDDYLDAEDDLLDMHRDDDVDGVDIDSVDIAYDEEADADLDLAAEEEAVFDGESAPAEAADAEVAGAEQPEDDADDDGPEPPVTACGDDGAGEDEADDEGEQPQA